MMKMATVQIRRNHIGEEDGEKLLRRLNRVYDGKWVAILDSGEIVARASLDAVYSEAEKKSSRVAALFRASKKRQLMYR